jgi:hypothetical protein
MGAPKRIGHDEFELVAHHPALAHIAQIAFQAYSTSRFERV